MVLAPNPRQSRSHLRGGLLSLSLSHSSACRFVDVLSLTEGARLVALPLPIENESKTYFPPSAILQEGILVPFSLTGPSGDPRITGGTVLDRVGMHADISPTILDLLGLWKKPPAPPALPPPRSPEDLVAGLKRKQKELSESVRLAREEGGSALRASGAGGPAGGGGGSGGDSGNGGRARRPPGRGPGSGLVGDSLLGPDYRSCALSATHYGGKTLAVVAGDWKGLFMYRWEKRGDRTYAEVREFFFSIWSLLIARPLFSISLFAEAAVVVGAASSAGRWFSDIYS